MKIGIDFVGVTTPFYCHDGKGNLLLHKRSAACRDEQGRWDPGSGKLEPDLTLEENVLKEVQEEYGCAGEIQERLPVHDIFREQEGVRTHWVAAPFIVKVNPDQVINGEPHKIDELGWFRLDSLPEPLHEGFSYSLNKFRGIIEKYLNVQ